jgi:hypothetical protein
MTITAASCRQIGDKIGDSDFARRGHIDIETLRATNGWRERDIVLRVGKLAHAEKREK